MSIEILGTRLIAPFVGGGSFVWTSSIAVTMTGITLGLGLGSKLLTSAWANVGSEVFLSLSAFLILLCQFIALKIPFGFSIPAPILSLILSTLLFLPITITLGAVTPFLAKNLENKDHVSNIVTKLSAASTLGSILATLLLGFVLLGFFSHRTLLVSTATLLAVMSVWGLKRKGRNVLASLATVTVGILLFTVPYSHSALNYKDFDTIEDRYLIYDYLNQNHIPHRVIKTGVNGFQNEIDLHNPTSVVTDYLKLFQLDKTFNPNIKTALVIGGGVLTYPQDLNKRFGAEVHVAEIDGQLEHVAQQYFSYTPNPHMLIHSQDGRYVLTNTDKLYDAIYIDAFIGHQIPSHLVTKEMFLLARDKLNDDGLLAINIIDHLRVDHAQFVHAISSTLKQVFPKLRILSERPVNKYGNWVIFAFKDETIGSHNVELTTEFREITHLPVGTLLTDHFAPTEHLTWNVGF